MEHHDLVVPAAGGEASVVFEPRNLLNRSLMAIEVELGRGFSSVKLVHYNVGASLAGEVLASIRKLDFFAVFYAELLVADQ